MKRVVDFVYGEIIGQTEGQPPSKSSLFSVGLILNSGLNLHFSVEHSEYFFEKLGAGEAERGRGLQGGVSNPHQQGESSGSH